MQHSMLAFSGQGLCLWKVLRVVVLGDIPLPDGIAVVPIAECPLEGTVVSLVRDCSDPSLAWLGIVDVPAMFSRIIML